MSASFAHASLHDAKSTVGTPTMTGISGPVDAIVSAGAQAATATCPLTVTFDALTNAIKSKTTLDFENLLKAAQATALVDPATQINILHVVCQFGNSSTLDVLFKILSKEQLSEMARACSNETIQYRNGKRLGYYLPYLERNPLDPTEKANMQRRIEALQLTTIAKPLHEPIDLSEISTRYPALEKDNKSGRELLSKVIWAMTRVRALRFNSYTHPTSPSITTEIELKEIKAERDAQTAGLVFTDEYEQAKHYHNLTSTHPKTPFFNCHELAFLMYYFLYTEKGFKPNELRVVHFENSDHVFLMAGPNIDSPLPHFTQLKDTAFGDAHTGEFGFGTDLSQYMKGYCAHWSDASQRFVHINISFNIASHQITPLFAQAPKQPIVLTSLTLHSDRSALLGDLLLLMALQHQLDQTQKTYQALVDAKGTAGDSSSAASAALVPVSKNPHRFKFAGVPTTASYGAIQSTATPNVEQDDESSAGCFDKCAIM